MAFFTATQQRPGKLKYSPQRARLNPPIVSLASLTSCSIETLLSIVQNFVARCPTNCLKILSDDKLKILIFYFQSIQPQTAYVLKRIALNRWNVTIWSSVLRVHNQVTCVAAWVSVLFDLVWFLNGAVDELSEKSVYKSSYFIINLLFHSRRMYFIIHILNEVKFVRVSW